MGFTKTNKDIKKNLISGNLIDLLNNLSGFGKVDSVENQNFKSQLEIALYKKGYLPFFKNVPSASSILADLPSKNRFFFLEISSDCNLYFSISPVTNFYELKYITYENQVPTQQISTIIHTLVALDIVETY